MSKADKQKVGGQTYHRSLDTHTDLAGMYAKAELSPYALSFRMMHLLPRLVHISRRRAVLVSISVFDNAHTNLHFHTSTNRPEDSKKRRFDTLGTVSYPLRIDVFLCLSACTFLARV